MRSDAEILNDRCVISIHNHIVNFVSNFIIFIIPNLIVVQLSGADATGTSATVLPDMRH